MKWGQQQRWWMWMIINCFIPLLILGIHGTEWRIRGSTCFESFLCLTSICFLRLEAHKQADKQFRAYTKTIQYKRLYFLYSLAWFLSCFASAPVLVDLAWLGNSCLHILYILSVLTGSWPSVTCYRRCHLIIMDLKTPRENPLDGQHERKIKGDFLSLLGLFFSSPCG